MSSYGFETLKATTTITTDGGQLWTWRLESEIEKGRNKEDKAKSSGQGASQLVGKEVTSKTLPFPKAFFASKKKFDSEFANDAYSLFNKLEINVPMVQFLKGNPKYIKLLKELCDDK